MNFPKNTKILLPNNSALLIIDIQEKIFRVMRKPDILINNILKLVKGVKILNLPIYHTEQYPQGLGPTIEQVKKELNENALQKLSFSCLGADDLFVKLQNRGINKVIVSGVEAHVCVQQTVLDLLESGFQVNLIVDAVSSRKKIDYITAINRMEKEGAILSTVESVLFELLQSSDNSNFKSISKLVK